MNSGTLFDGWGNVGRVVLVGAAAYVVMVVELRVAGKRTLAKMNAFDLVVTVALGSVLATIALSRSVSLVEGLAAITLLVAAQWLLAWLSVHSGRARRIVRADPSVVFAGGTFDDAALEALRVSRGEVEQAIRSSGCGDLEKVAVVVLEPDGSLSVISGEQCDTGTALPSSRRPTAPLDRPPLDRPPLDRPPIDRSRTITTKEGSR